MTTFSLDATLTAPPPPAIGAFERYPTVWVGGQAVFDGLARLDVFRSSGFSVTPSRTSTKRQWRLQSKW